ncbi:MAG: hypothetical protein V7K98_17585 [Nostoc sp.]|uniref:hypothetical protein n=1 Tax=Nostoc sp. TaxID=1180 RepID=UPI002FFAED61
MVWGFLFYTQVTNSIPLGAIHKLPLQSGVLLSYKKYCAGKVIDAKRAFVEGKLFVLPMGYPAMMLGDGQVYRYLLSFYKPRILNELGRVIN